MWVYRTCGYLLTHPLRLPRGRRSRPIDLSIQILDFQSSVITECDPSYWDLTEYKTLLSFAAKPAYFTKESFSCPHWKTLLAPNWSVRLSLTDLTTTFSLLSPWATFLVCKTEPDPSYTTLSVDALDIAPKNITELFCSVYFRLLLRSVLMYQMY